MLTKAPGYSNRHFKNLTLMKKFFSKIDKRNFCSTIGSKEVSLYVLKNSGGMEMSVTNFGARIAELFVPDRNGEFADVVLGHDTLDKYVNYKGARFLGATVGRYANRISGGRFSIGKKTYRLETNSGSNALHGGSFGFDMKVWDVVTANEAEISFHLSSPDGEAGYPGNLEVDMSFKLTEDNALHIEYRAVSDADTVLNLTNHSFFNLHGEGIKDINDHILTIFADKFTPVNENLVPTGEISGVAGTPFDFRVPTRIGERLSDACSQLSYGNGYDHNWVLNKTGKNIPEPAAVVYEPGSGRVLTVSTTQPGIQFYGGNAFCGKENGKNGLPYNRAAAFALETQHFPDSPNIPHFPSTLLKAGDEYKHSCIYKFGLRQ